jgi:hypothetical protein
MDNIEYDNDIDILLKRLQMVKEERKRAERCTKQTEHRLYLLQNQEKLAAKKLEMTRRRIEEVLNSKIDIFEERANNSSQFIKTEKLNRSLNKKRKYSSSKTIQQEEMKRQREIEKMKAIEKAKEEQIRNEIIEKKNKLKEELLRKIQIDEEERLKLEDELAGLRKEEVRIVNFLNTEDKHILQNINIVDRLNLEEYN